MRRTLACAVSLAAALSACGDSNDDGNAISDGAARDDVVSAPGSPLGNGFKVAEGSALIGVPVPLGTTVVQDGEPVTDEGWTAYLFVTGDPEDVLVSYLAQAEEQGLTPAPLPDWEPFGEEGDDSPVEWARCGAGGGAAYFRCAATAWDGGDRCLDAELIRSDSASHLELTLMLNQWSDTCGNPTGVPAKADGGVPDVPEQWPDRPRTGEEFGAPWEYLSDVVVQDGSEVIAAPVPGAACGGVTAVLAVNGDPEAVLDRYVRHFHGLTSADAHETAERAQRDGVTLERRVVNEMAGGRFFTADLVTVDGEGGAWLYLTGCTG